MVPLLTLNHHYCLSHPYEILESGLGINEGELGLSKGSLESEEEVGHLVAKQKYCKDIFELK